MGLHSKRNDILRLSFASDSIQYSTGTQQTFERLPSLLLMDSNIIRLPMSLLVSDRDTDNFNLRTLVAPYYFRFSYLMVHEMPKSVKIYMKYTTT
jgi:hypothetical protein